MERKAKGDVFKENMPNQPNYIVYIPENIDLDLLLNQFPINVPHAKDYLAYLLYLIHSVPAYNKDNKYEGKEYYVALSSSLIQQRVARYADLFQWLEDLRIIIINQSYMPGSNMGYKFTQQYSVELKEYVITTKTLVKSISTWKTHKKEAVLKPKDLLGCSEANTFGNQLYSELAEYKLQYLSKYFNSKFKLDKRMAEAYLRVLKVEEEKHPSIDAVHRFNCRMVVVNKWDTDNVRFKVDDTSGRLHTNLVSLKSELRGALTYEDQPLASADIKNSQPLLSLTLLNYDLFTQNEMLRRIAIYNKLFKYGIIDNNLNSYSNMLLNFIRTHSNASDIIHYRQLVLSGQIYEHFGNVLVQEGMIKDLHGSELRSYAKNQLFQTLFNRNQAINYTPALRIFKKIFPTVHEIFKRIKFKKHNTLACILQNLEAEIVLFRTCGDIAQIDPNIPMFTIHDSIATTTNHIDLVVQKLSQHLLTAVHNVPQIKIESWDESLLEEINIASPEMKISCVKEASYGYYFYDESISLGDMAKSLRIKKMALVKGLRTLNVFNEKNIPQDIYKPYQYFEYGINKNGNQFTRVNPNGVAFLMGLTEKHPSIFF